jgi:hypothetical protein
MLHSYSIRNFQSFYEPVEVSFRMTKKSATLGWDTASSSGQRLTTAMAVIGPNGAGKTALIKPLAFAGWFIADSFQTMAPTDRIPLRPYFDSDQPIEMEFEADDKDGTLWKYVIKATQQRVIHEALYRKQKSFSYVFLRDWDESEQHYNIKQQNFGFAPAEAKKVRQNASLISTAAQYGVDVAEKLASLCVSTNVTAYGRLHANQQSNAMAAKYFFEDAARRAEMENLLRSWDLGLSGIEIREYPFAIPPGVVVPEDIKLPSQLIPFGVHELSDGSRHELPMTEESNGTQTAFVTLSMLLKVLAEGGIAVMDELENDMHPHMLEPLLDLFASPTTNPHHAQIIFTCHSAEVLNLLGKPQVMLVQKRGCQSEAWRLDTMAGVRSQDNLYAKYMSGAYGAVPEL